MTDVNSVTGGGNAALSQASTLASQQLTQDDFLKLMIEQFRNQDPTQPQDTNQMVGQMAQFSQIAATQEMQASFNQVATSLQSNQMLSASSLIGRQVLVPSSQITTTDGKTGGITGAVSVPGTTSDVQVTISDASGNPVRTLDLGAQPAGLATFQWDGLDASGKPAPPGNYTLSAGPASAPFTTYASGPVIGVGNTSNGANLQVGGVGSVTFNQIAQIL